MAQKVKDGKHLYWVDGSGYKVPEHMVSDQDKLIDEIVTKNIQAATELRAALENFKRELVDDTQTILDLIAEQFGEEWQGNATVYDYSKQAGIVIKNQKRKDFGAKVNAGIRKMDRWIDLAADRGEDMDLINMVRRFTKVDEGGRYDKDNLKILLGMTVNQEKELWAEAMEIIRSSEEVIGTKTYFRFLVRDPEKENRFNKIILDLADC